MARCFGDGDPVLAAYHDEEWGRPVTDERGLFERLSLEGFQSGLSWRTVLRKREAFRSAFRNFEPAVVAAFDDDDVARLMADTGIIRNRAKIEATIAGARATLRLHEEGDSLHALLLRHAPASRAAALHRLAELPARTPESTALATELKRLGFRFIGPTTAYATMQAVGIVDDHLAGCPVRGELEGGEGLPPVGVDASHGRERLGDPLLRDRDGGPDVLGEEADPQLLQEPPDLLQPRQARRVRRTRVEGGGR